MFGYQTNGGLIKTILIVVVALLILSAFGYNLQGLVNSPTTQDNFSYVWNSIVYVWNTYLKAPATYLYNIFITYIWDPALNNLEHIKEDQPTNVSGAAPSIPNPNLMPN